MGWIRLLARLSAFVLFLVGTAGLALILRLADVVCRRRIDRTPWAGRCFRGACRCLGLSLRYHGTPATEPALYVSNHISWCDIPVLGSLAPARFLSKAEVARWPLIGWLARQAGTLFIQRGGGQARRVKGTMARTLQQGESVLFFPEGTTSAGLTVLPFHGLLLQAARDADVPIQPVTISYRRDGHPDHILPFIGDDAFHHHLLGMLKQPPSRVDVLFHPPVRATGELTTGELAERLHGTVREGLRQIQAGRYDTQAPDLRTEDAPGLSPLPSLAAGQQSPDQNKA